MMIYVRVRLKPPAPKPAPKPKKPPKGFKGHPYTPPHNDPVPEPEYVVRTVAADTLGEASRKGEAMPDVLAVTETSFEPLT